MSSIDPRRLIAALDDLVAELGRWVMVSHEVIADATSAAAHGQEAADRARVTANIAAHQIGEESGHVASALTGVDQADRRARGTIERAAAMERAALELLGRCQGAQHRWHAELQAALAWQARAEQRVARAEVDLANAQRELASTQRQLSSAEGAYRACQRDREPTSCSSELKRLRQAESAVSAAQQWVRRAEAELAAARAELIAARQRVACCQQAVGHADEALGHATRSHERATNAHTHARRSHQYVESARDRAARATVTMEDASVVAEEMAGEARTAMEHASTARTQLRNATSYYEAANERAAGASRELRVRMADLAEYDRPLPL